MAQTTDPDEIDKQVQKVGDDRFDNFADIPFFWFALQVPRIPRLLNRGHSLEPLLLKPATGTT